MSKSVCNLKFTKLGHIMDWRIQHKKQPHTWIKQEKSYLIGNNNIVFWVQSVWMDFSSNCGFLKICVLVFPYLLLNYTNDGT